jgi:hypothetical protein
MWCFFITSLFDLADPEDEDEQYKGDGHLHLPSFLMDEFQSQDEGNIGQDQGIDDIQQHRRQA